MLLNILKRIKDLRYVFFCFNLLKEILHLLGFVCRSRKGSSGTGNLAIRCDRTFSNSSAAFLHEMIIKNKRYSNLIKSQQTDEEYEDYVHFHFASYHHEVYQWLGDLVLQLEHHYLMFLLTILVHNQAN